MRPRRKRRLIRRDANRIARGAQVRVEQVDGTFILVTGDSMVSQLLLTPVSNYPVIDAVFPGLESRGFASRIGPILSGRHPLITILSIGTNDALKRECDTEKDRAAFRETLERIGDIVEGSELTIMLSLPRIAGTSAAYAHRRAAMDNLNDVLRTFASERGWTFFDCAVALRDVALPNDARNSSDGLHLSPAAAGALAQILRQSILDRILTRETNLAAECVPSCDDFCTRFD